MKKKKKRNTLQGVKSAVRCIAFLSILLLLIVRSYEVLSWKDTLGDYISSVEQLYATEDNKIDVVFTGSSHTYCGVSPAYLWNETGIAAFNMTTSGQDKLSTYYYLKELLKTQSPKVVFVELWGLTFDKHGVTGNEYRNMMGMPLSENSIDLIDAYMADNEEMNLTYKLRWPIVHTRYKELDIYDFEQYDFSQYGRGVDLNYKIGSAAYPLGALEYYGEHALEESNQKWVEDLYALSIEEDFELVFFSAPTELNHLQQAQINAVGRFAEEHNLGFLDFNRLSQEIGFDYETEFLDGTHLNGYGAERLTSYLGKYLEENYDLKDHRGDSSYSQWDDAYTRHVLVKDTFELKQCETFDTYVYKLQNMKNVTTYISFEGAYHATITSIPSYIKMMLGLSDEAYEKGGTFQLRDGKLTLIMDNESTEVYIEQLSEHNILKIQNMNLVDSSANNSASDMMLNMEVLGISGDGVNFAVYDNFRNEVIDTRWFF